MLDQGMPGWSSVTPVLGALAIGAPLAHALDMPVRRTHDVGGVIEVAAVIATVTWAALVARWGPAPVAARGWALAGAGCPVLASVFRARFPPPHSEADDAPGPAPRRGETTG